MIREEGRMPDELRPVKIVKDYLKYAEGSCLAQFGNTKVICSASVEESVPMFLKRSGRGWITAEYGMLPRSCKTRTPREAMKGRPGGRTFEIQRLIGRSMRAVCDMKAIGERTLRIDCDVLQADGGTRCAGITGSFVALCLALQAMKKNGVISRIPISDYVAAVSVGILEKTALLDLDYEEDSRAAVDMNVIMTGKGRFIELQGTAEKEPFDKASMDGLIDLAGSGVKKIVALQKKALKGIRF
ncbi:ribonuclease PH [Candidatus Omnitrophota bacterium]